MSLLTMVNSVRGKLREERTTAQAITDSSDELNTEIIDLVNDAGSEILEGDRWPFDVRHDGRFFFPASQSGVNGLFGESASQEIYSNTTQADLVFNENISSGQVFEDIDLAGFRCSGNRVRARVLPSDTSFGNTSWIIANVEKWPAWLRLTLDSNLYLETPATNGAWTTYANEVVIPSTVKEVLSVRHQQQNIALEFVDRSNRFDHEFPRPTDAFSQLPEVVMVGGTITSTSRTATIAWDTISAEAAVTGIGVSVWPIPSSDTHIHYNYRVQHSDLSAATDTWTGVPENILGAIEWRALQMAYDSGIQSDPQMAARVERNVRLRLAEARALLTAQPNLRRVPTTFRGRHSHHATRRWASQTIAAP